MTKNEYLDALCAHLGGLPSKEKQEILLDFQEHFASGLALGKTEEEICHDLGAPEFAAQQYVGEDKTAPIPPVPPVPPVNQAPPVYGAPPYSPHPPVSSGDKTMYTVIFILLLIFIALPGYPVAVSFWIAFLALFVGGIAGGVIMGSVGLCFLLISIGGIFLSVGSLIFIGITAALRACVRNINKG